MSDRGAVALAVAVAAGAWLAWSVPLAIAVLAVAVALAARRPVLLIVGGLLLASSLSARSWAGLVPLPEGTRAEGTATLLTDPEWSRFGQLQVEMRIGERRVLASARGLPASRLVTRLAGERLRVEGRARALTGRSAPHFRRRHIASRFDVTAVAEGVHPGNPFDQVANHVRRLLEAGSASMAPDHRALFAGFLLGDDRHQSPETVYDFRTSGLSHLLAVSGQNVAFILAIAGPLLRRLRLPGRFVAGVAVLLLFGVLTRWEPTVLRAVAMATLALIAATLGRPASSLRLLSLGVAGLLFVDPLLVGSVGFQLSAAASAGIVLLAPALRRRLPGPAVIAEPLAVTVAAQAAVAPILVATFDGVPVSSLPANLLAGPAAAPITVWGMVAGVAAGLSPDSVAELLHIPTRLLIGWVAAVARWGAGLPVGDLGGRETAALACLAVVALAAPRVRRLSGAAIVAVVAWVALGPLLRPPPTTSGAELADGARLWTADGTVVVVDGPDAVALLSGLREARIRRIDALVVTSHTTATSEAVAAVTSRIPTRVVVRGPPVGSGRAVGARYADLRRLDAQPRDGNPEPHHRLVLRQRRVL